MLLKIIFRTLSTIHLQALLCSINPNIMVNIDEHIILRKIMYLSVLGVTYISISSLIFPFKIKDTQLD